MTLNPFQLRKREPKRESIPDRTHFWFYSLFSHIQEMQLTKNQNQARNYLSFGYQDAGLARHYR
jgi:hypothetical protein